MATSTPTRRTRAPHRSISSYHAEWLSLLETSGPFLSIPVLTDTPGFLQGLPGSDSDELRELRREIGVYYDQWLSNKALRRPDPALDRAWFKVIVEDLLEWDDMAKEGQAIPEGIALTHPEHKETIRPDVVFEDPDSRKPRVLVLRYPASQDLHKPVEGSRWSESPANRMADLLHATDVRLGLVTNGEEWLLVNAPAGEPTGFTSWFANLWFEEPPTFVAFRALLGVERLVGVPEDEQLEGMLARSAEDQANVTIQLGDQVRQAIELLVDAIDREDDSRHGALLEGVTESEVYESAIAVMMRLVFLLFAEDQRPPLFGGNDDTYDQSYSVSGLIQALERAEQENGQEYLELRRDAWPRLLASFRLVFAGSAHDHMRQPAYGGSLFDPDRFPFLEGRTRRTSWDQDAAAPLPLNNRTVLHMLQALQFIEVKGKSDAGRQRISFRALDVEQIGHVYEQLLEHTAKRADGPVLALVGTTKKGVKDEPEIALGRLEAWAAKGEGTLLKELKEATGRSESALKKALAVEPEPADLQRLRLACVTDEIFQRARPFAGLIRDDRAGRPLVFRPGGLYVTRGDDRSTTGAHYTPRSLTESIVQHALEPLVYTGPAEGTPREQWRLNSPRSLLELNICDPAMGSGAFLVQACRYLSERLVEAWDNVAANDLLASALKNEPVGSALVADRTTQTTRHSERSEESPREALSNRAQHSDIHIAPDGSLSRGTPSELLLPADKAERLAIARRLVADHCLYGVDVNPLAVDMAKLSLWLVTLQKDRPFTFLDHRLRCGDSLLGISDIKQLLAFSLGGEQRSVAAATFAAQFRPQIERATSLRQKIEAIRVLDVHDSEEQEHLLRDAEQITGVMKLGADLLIAAQLHPEKKMRETLRGQFLQRFSLLVDGLGQLQRKSLTAEGQRRVVEGMEALRRDADRWLDGKRPFHWPLEFPEIFVSAGTYEAPKGFSVIVGNPPFLGGSKLSGQLGDQIREYLVTTVAGNRRGNADLAGYFVLRSMAVLMSTGMLGLVLTNTIAQGDTREVGLDQLAAQGKTIIRAVQSIAWPGVAALEVSHLWIRNGAWDGTLVLNGAIAPGISTSLTLTGRVTGKPHRLASNQNIAYIGSYVHGAGFLLQEHEAKAFIKQDQKNEQVVQPYLSGEDLNSRPDQLASRWVVSFRGRSEEDAKKYRGPYDHVEKLVKPERMKLLGRNPTANDTARRWWQFKRPAEDMRNAIAGLDQTIVLSRVSKYLAPSIIGTGTVFSDGIVVVASDSIFLAGVLNSTFHETWAFSNASTLETRLRYTPSDCFETFPLPSYSASVARICEELLDCRTKYQMRASLGLTDFLNLVHQESRQDSTFRAYREMIVSLDVQTALAYGWEDLDLEHGFHETKQGVRFTISERARREVLDRLLELNHQRYAEEVAQGLHEKGKGKGGTRKKAASASAQTKLF